MVEEDSGTGAEKMPITSVTDAVLMRETARGSRDSLEKLVRRHANGLLTFIVRMVGNHHRGEELFQEVVLTVWLKRRLYTYPRPFKPWLYRIALNRCREEFRKGGAAPITFSSGDSVEAAGPSPDDAAVHPPRVSAAVGV